MRSVVIGAVSSTAIILKALHNAGFPPLLLATFDAKLGPRRHADYVDLSLLVGEETRVVHIETAQDPALIELIQHLAPDIIFIVGWSQLIGPELRGAARRFCVGFHPTLLPALRGRAPLGWTIRLGLRESGCTLFVIDDGADSGPIIAQTRFPLEERETVLSLAAKASQAMEAMMPQAVGRLLDDGFEPERQVSDGISYAARLTAEDGLIDWSCSVEEIDRLVRAAGEPYEGAFTFTATRKVRVWRADPIELPYPYFAAAGQVVLYDRELPVVRCGDGGFLILKQYQTSDGAPLRGQLRFRARLGKEGEGA